MAYTAEISRANPGCFLFMIDQSASMSEPFGGDTSMISKADYLATVINRLLTNLVLRCSKDMSVWRYFHVGVIGYGATVGPAFDGFLAGRELVGIDEVADSPARIDDKYRRVPDGAGGLVEEHYKFPVWFDAVADNGTPMRTAFLTVHRILEDWVQEHWTSYPPVVINISDGEANDASPVDVLDAADTLKSLHTGDGAVVLLNLHLSSRQANPIHFPADGETLPDGFAQLLFNMASRLPPTMKDLAQSMGYRVNDHARGFVFNADMTDVVQFLDIGTRAVLPAALR